MLSRVARKKVQAELDLIAEELETQGHTDLATQVDEINDALMGGEISPEVASEELETIADKAELEELRAAAKKPEKEMKKEKKEKKADLEEEPKTDLSKISDADLQAELELRSHRNAREEKKSEYRSKLLAKMKSRKR